MALKSQTMNLGEQQREWELWTGKRAFRRITDHDLDRMFRIKDRVRMRIAALPVAPNSVSGPIFKIIQVRPNRFQVIGQIG